MQNSGAHPRVLVVDDSATSRVVIEKQLKKFACLVETAANGGQAITAMEKSRYALVLLDCYMPDMNGYEVARYVRRMEAEQGLSHTPIIAISAEADAEHVQLCLDSGMDGILGKPLPQDELKKILSLWCDIDVDAIATPSPAPIESKPVDLVGLFRTTSLDDFADLRKAHAAGDRMMLKRLAHRMKGAALTMEKAGMVSTLEGIEAIAQGGDAQAQGQLDLLMLQLERQLAAL
ncbi:response regulator [Herbaspirillum lusitanum]|uniref:Response regulator n=1 Tax=Herbaspirillum lusitanum TaxID=213312 RepID=A0ABW9AJ92_9BURK